MRQEVEVSRAIAMMGMGRRPRPLIQANPRSHRQRAPVMKRPLIKTGIAVLAIAAFVAVSAVVIHAVQLRSRHQEVVRSFKLALLEISNFRDVFDAMPPSVVVEHDTSEPLYSWRFELMGFMDQGRGGYPADYVSPFTLRWDDPRSLQMDTTEFMDALKRSNNDPPFVYPKTCTGEWRLEPMIMALTGPGTVFDELQGGRYTHLDNFSSRMERVQPPKLNPIVPDDTIIIVEVNHAGINWRQPGDLDIRTMPRAINAPDQVGISSIFPDRFHVGFSDGEVWALSSKIPFETLEKFFTIEGARENSREDLLLPYSVWN